MTGDPIEQLIDKLLSDDPERVRIIDKYLSGNRWIRVWPDGRIEEIEGPEVFWPEPAVFNERRFHLLPETDDPRPKKGKFEPAHLFNSRMRDWQRRNS